MPIGGKEEDDKRFDHCRDLPALILQNLRKFGNQSFMTDGLLDVKYTFKQLHDNAIAIAVALRKINVGEGTYVAFLTDTTTFDALAFTVGVWLAGACVCPINTCILPGEIAQILETCSSTLVYCDESNIALFEDAKRQLGRSFTVFTNGKKDGYISISDVPSQSEEISSFSTIPYDPYDHITYVLFTSGTTGVAKGVMLSSYASLITGGRLYISKGSTLVTTPPCWISNASAFVNSLLEGTELIIPRVKYLPGTKQVDLLHIARCVEKYKPKKWMSAPSFVLDLCYTPKVGEYDFSSLVHLSVGGSSILPAQKKFICDTLFKGRRILQERYGATEVGGWVTREWSFPPPDYDSPKGASLGPPCTGVELKVVDPETGKELGPDQVGEIWVRSGGMMKGYINKEFPETYTREDWYDMGDMGYYDPDEWLYFQSRSKEILKYRGFQIAPKDLEKVILTHPDVLEVCVVGAPHPVDGEWPTAFVVKKKNSSLSESSLTSFFNDQVGNEKKLRGGVIFKTSLPQSSVGKLLRKSLTDEAKALALSENLPGMLNR